MLEWVIGKEMQQYLIRLDCNGGVMVNTMKLWSWHRGCVGMKKLLSLSGGTGEGLLEMVGDEMTTIRSGTTRGDVEALQLEMVLVHTHAPMFQLVILGHVQKYLTQCLQAYHVGIAFAVGLPL